MTHFHRLLNKNNPLRFLGPGTLALVLLIAYHFHPAHAALEVEKAEPVDPALQVQLAPALNLREQARTALRVKNFDLARTRYREAVAAYEKIDGAPHRDMDSILDEAARVHAGQHDYAHAVVLYQRLVTLRERVHGPTHSAAGHALAQLANMYDWLNDVERGLAAARRAIGIFTQSKEYAALGRMYILQALLLETHGSLDAGIDSVMRGTLIISEHSPDMARDHLVALGFHVYARLLDKKGDYPKALAANERSLPIRRRVFGDSHFYIAQSLNQMALAHLRLDNAAAARPLFEQALHVAREVDTVEELWRAQDGLRASFAKLNQPDLAVFFGKQAVNTIQGMRKTLTTLATDTQKSFLADKTSVYRGLADLLIESGRLPEAQQVLLMLKEEEFFEFVRRTDKQDARTAEVGFTGGEAAWQKRYADISARLGSIGTELATLDQKARSGLTEAETAQRTQLRADRKVAQQAFDAFLGELMRDLSGASAQRNRDVGERGLANLRALQGTLSALSHNAVTVHYLMGDTRLSILLTTPSVQIARTAPIGATALNQKIAALQSALLERSPQALTLARELHGHLIEPIASDLRQANAKTLMVSLDGALRYIPLAALHDGQQFLVEQFRLSIFTEAAKDKLRDAPQATWRVAALGLTEAKAGFSALPSVKGELEGIVKSGNRGAMPGEMHLDGAFTANRLRDALDKGYPVLHVASHFKFQPGTEATSFLLLGDGSKLSLKDLKEDDYRFHDVDLMTLSACETAVGGGKDANGMEIEGLGALAQKQGAKAVIATLWPVADESTGILMQRFYALRESGKLTKAEALRQAQLEFIQGKHQPGAATTAQRGLNAPAAIKPAGYNHPYYWAPFILMGNWL